jgi:hypothetical protein
MVPVATSLKRTSPATTRCPYQRTTSSRTASSSGATFASPRSRRAEGGALLYRRRSGGCIRMGENQDGVLDWLRRGVIYRVSLSLRDERERCRLREGDTPSLICSFSLRFLRSKLVGLFGRACTRSRRGRIGRPSRVGVSGASNSSSSASLYPAYLDLLATTACRAHLLSLLSLWRRLQDSERALKASI